MAVQPKTSYHGIQVFKYFLC